MFRKITLGIILILSLAQCNRHYFLRNAAKYNLTQEEENLLKSKKIGVLGFHPFYSGYLKDVEPSIDFLSNDFIKLFQFVYDKKDSEKIPFDPSYFLQQSGKRRIDWRLISENTAKAHLPKLTIVNDVSINKPNTAISNENLKNFLKVYLEEVKHLNTKEILSLLDFSIKGKVYLKQYDFDYWIVGFHSPPRKGSYKAFSMLFSMYSFGLIPFWDDEKVKSTFWIFDSKLNLIQKFEMENEYLYMAATWLFWKSEDHEIKSDVTPIEVFEPDLKEFTKEFAKIVKERN